jgi:hypothetical protein
MSKLVRVEFFAVSPPQTIYFKKLKKARKTVEGILDSLRIQWVEGSYNKGEMLEYVPFPDKGGTPLVYARIYKPKKK